MIMLLGEILKLSTMLLEDNVFIINDELRLTGKRNKVSIK